MQLNMDVAPFPQVKVMSKLQPMILPILWFENGVNLPKKYVNLLKYQLVL